MGDTKKLDNVYLSASIVANVGFSSESEEERGATGRHPVHALRIQYTEDGHLHDFTVCITADDLEDLRSVLDSVQSKDPGPGEDGIGAPETHPVVRATAGVFAGRASANVDLDELLDRAREDRAGQILHHKE